eukprot:CAMPEP_0181218588 /NCGR_PEP_ID=MMETSP1096-20121128/27776_1 /TAXON_ID=156174 ORGANISM="Chrysochromulina ericina, Strain CCMP281" /NCGR_SAMPLE_ID=MMETSP1096 /ASSEMBLY_ACC=CAM_ASM_000453 /LENGTH=96 /DNA_ID=CAMNT_0023310819 /DNA_START=310 /DNA_END=601 /DNA_ORIENTATION=+
MHNILQECTSRAKLWARRPSSTHGSGEHFHAGERRPAAYERAAGSTHGAQGDGASTAAVEVLATASAGGGVAATPWVYWCGAEELFLASVEVLFPG